MCQTLAEGGRRCSRSSLYSKKLFNLKAKEQYHKRNLRRNGISPKEKIKATEKLAEVTSQISKFTKAHDLIGPNIIPYEMKLTPVTEKVISQLIEDGMTPYVVGGTIRDKLLGLQSKDMDIEVYGGETKAVIKSLRKLGQVDEVGKAFGVLKIRLEGEDLDISLPRTDNKIGDGHRGFEVSVDPYMTPEEASLRRDFTINAMMYNHEHGVIVDPHGGLEDLKSKTLRHVSDAFDEDPLRVLRGVQMASRFEMELDPSTVARAAKLKEGYKDLAAERVAIEFEKLYAKGKDITRAFNVLKQTQWDENFPGLANVNDSKLQSSLKAAEGLAKRENLSNDQKTIMFASILASRLGRENGEKFIQTTLIGHSMMSPVRAIATAELPQEIKAESLRHWAANLKVPIRTWALVEEAKGNTKAIEILSKAEGLGIADSPEIGLIQGRDILAQYPTVKPGAWMGNLLRDALNEQYAGTFRDKTAATKWIESNIGSYLK